MLVNEFVKTFTERKVVNTKINGHAVSDYLKKELDIKSYVPFREKRKIAEMIVMNNIKEVNGIKKFDSVDGYVAFIVASIMAHTSLQFSNDPVSDYDLLAESGLLTQIIAEFQNSHDEIDTIRKMVLAAELEDNNVGAVISRFLNKISGMLDGVLESIKDMFGDFDLSNVLDSDFNKEDLAKLSSFLDRMK